MYCLYNHILYTQPKCFGNTVERYGHANKASFEFERERVRGRERVGEKKNSERERLERERSERGLKREISVGEG